MVDDASLLDLFDARHGVIGAVGAGGKKSLLARLATAHPGRVAITATVFTTFLQEHLGFAVAVAEDERLAAAVAALDPGANVAYACPGEKPGRRAGVSADTIARIHREGGFAATFVKADGARMRLIKSPGDGEPAVPDCCTTVLPILSALALGEPLSARIAHRVERVERIARMRAHEPIGPSHLARLFASPEGLLKGTEGRRVVAVINMVDDAAREALAREAAVEALGLTDRFDRVVLARLADAANPIVAVVNR